MADFQPPGGSNKAPRRQFFEVFFGGRFWKAFLGENCMFLFVFVAFCPYFKSSRDAGESVFFAVFVGTSSGAAAAPKKLQKSSQK